jgi:hypothetical protein
LTNATRFGNENSNPLTLRFKSFGIMGRVHIKKGPIYLALGGWGLVGGFRRYIGPFGLTLTQLYPTERICQELFSLSPQQRDPYRPPK